MATPPPDDLEGLSSQVKRDMKRNDNHSLSPGLGEAAECTPVEAKKSKGDEDEALGESKSDTATASLNLNGRKDGNSNQSFQEMVEFMESHDLIFNDEDTECSTCYSELAKGEGIVLRECLHTFCRECLIDTVQYAEDSATTVNCPYREYDYACNCDIQEREIRALVPPKILEKYLARCINSVGKNQTNGDIETEQSQSYQKMLELTQNHDLIYTAEYVECPLCCKLVPIGEGIMLRDCLHSFCRDCLVDCIQFTENPTIKSPYRDPNYSCDYIHQEREIKALVSPEIFENYLSRSLQLAGKQTSDNYHCKTPDCTGWCVIEGDVKVFICPVCRRENFVNDEDDEDEKAECPVCFNALAKGEGIVLRECFHIFCKECLADCVKYGDDSTATVKCPYRDDDYICNCTIHEREIKALVSPEVFEKYLTRSVRLVENQSSNSFHCKTPDCSGWCLMEDEVNVFDCPVCQKENCITCAAVHEGMDCKIYQRELSISGETDEDAKKSLRMLKDLLEKSEALHCPACNVIVIKKGGCDWLVCSYCKTEICWATKGFRWGKKGHGDTSGGCRCLVNGKECHPSCGNCH